jgi:hypothetical protein
LGVFNVLLSLINIISWVVDPDQDQPGYAFIWLSWIWIRIGNADPDPGMNITDHISESLKPIFWAQNILNSLMRTRNLSDSGSGMEKFESGIRDKHPRIRSTVFKSLDPEQNIFLQSL